MQVIKKQLEQLLAEVEIAMKRLSLKDKKAKLDELNDELASPGIWNDSENAQNISKQAAKLESQITPWNDLESDIRENLELAETGDESLESEIKTQFNDEESRLKALKKDLLFKGEFDDHNAILRITSGAGGTDAQDWAEILERMYLRWGEKSGMTTRNIERSTGEEAGIKTSVIEFDGAYAYGRLRSEHGVHRLVRLSPFNSDNLRQTSFALVEVLPQIDSPEDVKIDEKDLKIDVYRSGGHGGQSVNTTDSAVRITHLPTGIVVAIQNERSQLQNRETAMKIMLSKLTQLKIEQHAEELSELTAGESANWGSQIRNYVLHPYQMVKDTRTKYESKDTKAVLGGDIDEFMTSFLENDL